MIRKKFLRDNDLCWFEDETGFCPLVDVSTWLQLLTQGNMFWINESLSLFREHDSQQSYFKGTGLAMVMCWARFLKRALDEKIFFENEKEIRLAFLRWMRSLALKWKETYASKYYGAEVSVLEEFYIAMAKAMRNGYKIELPKVEYSGVNKFKKILGRGEDVEKI